MNADMRCPDVDQVDPPFVEVRYQTFQPLVWSIGWPFRSSKPGHVDLAR